MNVFVKERAHQSVAAWCLHQCVQGTPCQSIIQKAFLSLSERKKDSTQKCDRESLAFKEVIKGTLVTSRKELSGGYQMSLRKL